MASLLVPLALNCWYWENALHLSAATVALWLNFSLLFGYLRSPLSHCIHWERGFYRPHLPPEFRQYQNLAHNLRNNLHSSFVSYDNLSCDA